MLDINRNDLQVVKRRYVLVRISVALIKHYGQKATSRERIYLTYISWVMVYKEKQRQEPRGKDWVKEAHCVLACSSWLSQPASLYNYGYQLRVAPPPESWVLLPQSIKKMPKYRQAFLLESSFSQTTLASVS